MPSPYGLAIATISVLIFSAPNLIILAIGGLTDAAPAVGRPGTAELVFALLVTVVFQFAVFGLSMLPLLAAGRPYRRLLGPTRTTPLMVAIGLGVGVGVAVVAYIVNAVLILSWGDQQPIEQQLLEDALLGGWTLALALAIVVIAAPITEEVVFRGVFHRALAGRFGMTTGVVVSSAVFALIHIEVVYSQPLALGGLFVVGALLAVAYHLTGNLIVPILGHAVFNGISVSLAVLIDRLGVEGAAAVVVLGGGVG